MTDETKRDQPVGPLNEGAPYPEMADMGPLDPGAPLGRTLRASPAGISSMTNSLTAYVIVEAESHDAAAQLFEQHPHFAIFPGDSVEIMEVLPMPGAP